MIDSKNLNEVIKELKSLNYGEPLNFHYKGDNFASSEDKEKLQILETLREEGYLYWKSVEALGPHNQKELNVRLTDSGHAFLDKLEKI